MVETVSKLRRDVRSAELAGDLERVAFFKIRILLFYLDGLRFTIVRRELGSIRYSFECYRSSLGPGGIPSDSIISLLDHLGSRIFKLADSVIKSPGKIQTRKSIRIIELATELILCKGVLDVAYVEERDLFDHLGSIYLRTGQFGKALRAFAEGASLDKGYSVIAAFFEQIEGPIPQVLASFLIAPRSVETPISISSSDSWANLT